jgi:hypothetical protein
LHNHAVSITDPAMAGGAIDIEPLLSTRQVLFGNRERKYVYLLAVDLSGVAGAIDAQMAARNRSLYGSPSGAFVAKETGCG